MEEQQLVDRLLNIVRLSVAEPQGNCCFDTGDFSYRWQSETHWDQEPVIRVWQDEAGNDQAFAWLSQADLHLVAASDSPGLIDEMIGWGEATALGASLHQRLRIVVHDGAGRWQKLLKHRGYEPGQPVLIQYSRGLDLPPPAAPLPSGFSVTSFENQLDIYGWVRAYTTAFAPEEMTIGIRERLSQSPLYRADLDLIARAPRGDVGAFALTWFDPVIARGIFEPLGCIPGYRRQGLTRSIMVEGLRRLRQLGAQQILVTTTTHRVAANKLYESLGFQPHRVFRTWSRLV